MVTKGRKVFFDLGAHHGEVLQQFVPLLGLDDTWEIHSFEPNPACQLADRLSHLELPLRIHQAAVRICDGTIGFRQQQADASKGGTEADGNGTQDG